MVGSSEDDGINFFVIQDGSEIFRPAGGLLLKTTDLFALFSYYCVIHIAEGSDQAPLPDGILSHLRPSVISPD
jgi:hypothetical protein